MQTHSQGQGLVRREIRRVRAEHVCLHLTPDVTRIPLQPDADLSLSPLLVSYSLQACLLSEAAACNGDSESFGAL